VFTFTTPSHKARNPWRKLEPLAAIQHLPKQTLL